MGKIEQAGGQPAGSATSPFSLPDHTRLVSSPLFRSSTLTESLEQTIVCSIKHWRLTRNEILSTLFNYLVVLFLLFYIHATVLINTKLSLCEKKIVEIINVIP